MTPYEAKLNRILDAVAMRPVDRIPVSLNGPAFVGRAQGVPIRRLITDFPCAAQASADLCTRLGADCIQTPIMSPPLLSTQWLSPVALPGRELPDDALWQVIEQETLTPEDYQSVLRDGFWPVYQDVLKNRLGDINAQAQPFYDAMPMAIETMRRAGVPVLNDGPSMSTPFEFFCGGRGMENFFCDDLCEDPELLKDVFDKTMESLLPVYRAGLPGALCCWIGGWRGSPSMISPALWEYLVWPYMKQLGELALSCGVIPLFHLDSNWDKAFAHFLELPEHRCILSLDGSSDMRLARRVLGDHSCLMGDVPAQLLSFGTEQESAEYTRSLIADVGAETGLIVCSGCDIPMNAQFENVRAMVETAQTFLS